jgi:hypothetical protein
MVNSSSSLAISCATPPKTPGFGKSYKVFSGADIISRVRKSIVTTGLLAVVLFFSAESRLVRAHRPFDQYGNLRGGDHAARLDNFAIQLLHETEAYGYVIVYAPESGSKRIRKTIVDYLVNTRGLPRERVKTAHGGYYNPLSEPFVKLYIVPNGAKPFEPLKHDVDLARFKGKLAEYPGWDPIELVSPALEDDPGIGPPVGSVVFDAFDDVFKAQKNAVAHVVAFNGIGDVPGTWRRVAESTVDELKRFGFAASRFKIGYGGQAKETKVQLWILPPGELPPVKDPASEPQPAKAIQIGSFDNGMLADVKNDQAVFDRLLLVMRKNPDLRACLIVRMAVPVPEDAIAEVEEETELADLPKLVEKWKTELAAKHKIRAERVVILFANAQEYHLPTLEVWVVPPGQPLPDPDH